jgi:AcrR family transcriptional regulator
MPISKPTPKAEDTSLRILTAALGLFRDEGFDSATMRDIAAKAGVAAGAAYYYYPSKDAIVMAFYQRSCEEMQPQLEAALRNAAGLEKRLRALLRNGADPKHPLSPFSAETKAIREIDLAWFRRILADCGIRIPKDLEPHMPGVLWFFQMGVIFFWVIDDSPGQARTMRLLDLGPRIVATLLRLSTLPLTRPLRKTALELIRIVEGDTA